jgi:hypothetical protein
LPSLLRKADDKTLNPSCRSRVLKWKLTRGNRVNVVVRPLKTRIAV